MSENKKKWAKIHKVQELKEISLSNYKGAIKDKGGTKEMDFKGVFSKSIWA